MVSELKEHKNCCRLCLEHIGHKKSWKITEKIQQKFYNLTHVQLKLSEKYSNRTCKTCAVLLYETSGYQEKLVSIQKKLYGFEDDVEMEEAKAMPLVEAKIEDFVETFVSVKEERLESENGSEHSYNYIQEADDTAYSDYEPPALSDSDSDDYFTTAENKPAANSKRNISQTPDTTTAGTTRYTEEQLKNAVRAVLEGERIYLAADKYNIPRSTLTKRVRSQQVREAFGFDLLDNDATTSKVVKTSTRYTEEQMKNAMNAVIRDGLQLMEAANKFDVPRQTLSHRINKYHEGNNSSDSEDYSPRAKVRRSESFPIHRSSRYTEEQLESAVRAVVEGGAQVMESARKFRVPHSTIQYRIKHGPPKPRGWTPKVVEPPKKEKKCPGRGVIGMRRRGILSEVPLYCDLCAYSTFSKNDLVVHMTLGHKIGFTCRKCKAKFPTKEAMKEHKKTEHSEWHCPHCNIDFEERRPWSTHMVRHRRSYTCEICGIQVQSHKYKYHVESHDNEKRVLCTATDCDKIFKTKAGLNHHINNFHTSPATQVCPICGSLYSNLKKLKRHMARMHATPNICCKIPGCTYKSTRKEYVATHMSKHNDIDEYTKMELVRVFKATRINNNTANKVKEGNQ